MPEVGALTLVMAVQAVDHQIAGLVKDKSPESMDSDEVEMYMAYWKAAVDLRRAYEEAYKASSNLPRYEDLAKHT